MLHRGGASVRRTRSTVFTERCQLPDRRIGGTKYDTRVFMGARRKVQRLPERRGNQSMAGAAMSPFSFSRWVGALPRRWKKGLPISRGTGVHSAARSCNRHISLLMGSQSGQGQVDSAALTVDGHGRQAGALAVSAARVPQIVAHGPTCYHTSHGGFAPTR